MPVQIEFAPGDAPVPASVIIQRAGYLLTDEQHKRWTEQELLVWINEGTAATINLQPAAGNHDVILVLVDGARQELSDRTAQLIGITCNTDADGASLRTIQRTDFSLISRMSPEWMMAKRQPAVRQFMFDSRAPVVFYVFPPVAEGVRVRGSIAFIPEDLTDVDEPIALRVEYAEALVNYVCYRAFSKDSEYANGTLAAAFYGAFQNALAMESDAGQRTSPEVNKA